MLVVDNADDMGVMFGTKLSNGIADFLPESDHGVKLFTSRRGEVAESLVGSDVLEVGTMSEEDAVLFLNRSLNRKSSTEDGAIKQLVVELACLPLAITQAAAYINTNKIRVSTYLDLLRKTDADLVAVMSREFRDSTRYKQSANAVAIALKLGVCLNDDGRISEAVVWLKQSCAWRERNLAEDNADRLLSQISWQLHTKRTGRSTRR